MFVEGKLRRISLLCPLKLIKVFKTQAKLFLPAPSDLPSQKEVMVVSFEHLTSFADLDYFVEALR